MENLELLSVEELFSMLPPHLQKVEEFKCVCGKMCSQVVEYNFEFHNHYYASGGGYNKYGIDYKSNGKLLVISRISSNLKEVLVALIKSLIELGYEDKLLPVRKEKIQ